MSLPLSVAEWMVARLESVGVCTVFGVPGGLCSALDHALYRSKIRMVVCQHETLAGYAAAGYHRATNRPGVTIVTGGPGALNAAPPLAAARLDGDGVIVIAGDVATADAGRGILQDGTAAGLDLVRAMGPLAGFATGVVRSRAAQVAFDRALARAQGPHPLPSFLSIPIDVQRAPAAATVTHPKASSAASMSEPALTAVVAELEASGATTLLVGRRGAREAAEEIVSLAESLAAPFIVDADAVGSMPMHHPLCVGSFGIGDDGISQRWVVAHPPAPLLAIGARLDDTTTAAFSPALLGHGVIQLDTSDEVLARAVDVRIATACDLRAAVSLLESRVRPSSPTIRAARAEEIRGFRASRVARPMVNGERHPVATAITALRELPVDTVITSDIGNHLLAMLHGMLVEAGRPFEMSLGLGGMGSGIGLALGLSVGGAARVCCVCGDGTLAMFGNELLTAAKYRIPVTFLVWHDGELGMVRQGIQRIYGASDDYSLRGFDLIGYGRSLGVEVCSVDGQAELCQALRTPSERPRLLIVPIDGNIALSNPREVVINFPLESPA